MLPRMTLSIAVLIIANLVPMAGALLLNWDAVTILLLYWAENFVVGFYSVSKMAMATYQRHAGPGHPKDIILHHRNLFLILFFCFHFGVFCWGHGFFLVTLLNLSPPDAFLRDVSLPGFWEGPPGVSDIFVMETKRIWQSLPDGFELPLICLFISHGISFVRDYLSGKEYVSITMKELIIQPYKRMVPIHFTLIIVALLTIVFGLTSAVPLLFILVIFKIGLDIRLHVREHGNLQLTKTW